MRIQKSETLETPDAEAVLSVLERSLHDISADVVREGGQITVRGLGPSQRTMNRNDITVLRVSSENNRTVIEADITYQASALLGNSPQDEIVSSKLERVLDRVKNELGTRRVRAAAAPSMAPERPQVAGATLPVEITTMAQERVAAPPVEGAVSPALSVRRESVAASEAAVARGIAAATELAAAEKAEGVPEKAAAMPDRAAGPSGPSGPSGRQAEAEGRVAAAIAALSGGYAVAGRTEPRMAQRSSPEGASAGPRTQLPEIHLFEAHQPEEPGSARPWGFVAAVACVIAILLIFLAWPSLMALVQREKAPSSGEGEVQRVARSNATKGLAGTRSELIHDEADPKVWLESWAEAMRTQDAAAQASFYADPVDRYFLKSNVSNANVWLDKQTAIDSRVGMWTFEVKNVVIQPAQGSTVRVRLVKHITSKAPDSGVSEKFIPAQLKLKRIDGQWKITAEQHLR